MPKPTVGRIVHYRSFGTPNGEYHSTCRAAIVTQVADDDSPAVVGLCAINPTGLFFHEACRQDESNTQGGTWHWPEREES